VQTLKCKKKLKKKKIAHENMKKPSLKVFWAAFLELPIRPKIDFPYWKLGRGTLCSFYFVFTTQMNLELFEGQKLH
jgi:hypothetical protein